MTTPVLVAGATGDLGDLGARIVRDLLLPDSHVRVLTRPGSGQAAQPYGENPRVEIVKDHLLMRSRSIAGRASAMRMSVR